MNKYTVWGRHERNLWRDRLQEEKIARTTSRIKTAVTASMKKCNDKKRCHIQWHFDDEFAKHETNFNLWW
jgi:hypothetical protein